jgi:hypothetical protein
VSADDRRNFLLTGRDMMLGALTTGALVASYGGAGIQTVYAQTSSPSASTAAFGWKIDNLGNAGANLWGDPGDPTR